MILPLIAWACATNSGSTPVWKDYSRDEATLQRLNLTQGKTLNCMKQLPSKGKIEGQKFSVVLSRSSPSSYRIGHTEDRPLRFFGILKDQEVWGELPDYDLPVRVVLKDLTQVTLSLYNQQGEIYQTIDFSQCGLH